MWPPSHKHKQQYELTPEAKLNTFLWMMVEAGNSVTIHSQTSSVLTRAKGLNCQEKKTLLQKQHKARTQFANAHKNKDPNF